jgi:hypothetical protein
MAKDPKFEKIADAEYKCRQCGRTYVHKLDEEDLTRGYSVDRTAYETMFYATVPKQNTHYRNLDLDPKKFHIAPNTYLHECGTQMGLGDLIGLVNIRTIEIHPKGCGYIRTLAKT